MIDFVDVDSDKWTQYAAHKKLVEKWIYAREARTLLAFERRAAAAAKASLFVSPAEAELFRKLAPEVASTVHSMNNGVDLDYFSPDSRLRGRRRNMPDRSSPSRGRWTIGPMSMPSAGSPRPYGRRSARAAGDAAFYIVGGNPTQDVKDLAKLDGVVVTGRVADVRPYIARADVVVAPMRIARGVQNKVLEGMAMGRPVVTTSQGLEGIDATPGHDLILADGAEAFAAAVMGVLDGGGAIDIAALCRNARQRMVDHYSWDASLSVLDPFLA